MCARKRRPTRWCRRSSSTTGSISRSTTSIDPPRQNESAIGFLSFALRTTGDPAALIPAVRETITAIDPNIGIDAIAPMERLEASSRARAALLRGDARRLRRGVGGPRGHRRLRRARVCRGAAHARRSACAWRSAPSAGQVLSLIMRRGLDVDRRRRRASADRRGCGARDRSSRCCSASRRSIRRLSSRSRSAFAHRRGRRAVLARAARDTRSIRSWRCG